MKHFHESRTALENLVDEPSDMTVRDEMMSLHFWTCYQIKMFGPVLVYRNRLTCFASLINQLTELIQLLGLVNLWKES